MKPFALIGLPLLFASCAALGLPVVPVAPKVRVKQLESRLITPDAIRFHVRIRIRNRMRARLDVRDVVWGVDVGDRSLFTQTYTGLRSVGARDEQWITLPFEIPMEDVPAEEVLRVRLRGVVHADGFGPVAFAKTRELPLPRLPELELEGVVVDPFDGELSVVLRVRNRSDFALTFSKVDTYLDQDGARHGLRRTDARSHVAPGATSRLRLTLRHGRDRVLDVRSGNFTVGGSIACQTPYGTLVLPVALETPSEARVQDHRRAGG